jgi:transcriptional regulator with XRE-family HTH domain
MAEQALGPRLRTLRAASNRTVATVATDAGLSVPYVANLENGRGNPTVETLSRLAAALGTRLEIEFVPEESAWSATATSVSPIPSSLVRLSRSPRFRRDVHALAEATGRPPADLTRQLIGALAGVAELAGHEPTEPDWHRLLDALLLVALHPHPGK